MTLEEQMREWLLDCFNDEDDQEMINELSYEQMEKMINRLFEGGMKEFYICCRVKI